jgi:DNA-binding MarR family transcriptional regulator
MKKNNKKTANGTTKDLMLPGDEAQIVHMLIICGLFLHRQMNMDFQRFGLKQQQFSVLNEIIRHGPISQKELGETLLFEKSNVSKIVKLLFENKWIRVVIAPHDRRLTLLSETPEGLAVWKNCMQAFHESSTELMSLLPKGEESGIIRLLKKLQKAFKSK